MPLYDFRCKECGLEEEVLCRKGKKTGVCSKCGGSAEMFWKQAPQQLTNIIPSYPGSKKQAAGYVHSHGDQPATKVQSGRGGCVKPG
jgi:putative FmdB family regulatory protein